MITSPAAQIEERKHCRVRQARGSWAAGPARLVGLAWPAFSPPAHE